MKSPVRPWVAPSGDETGPENSHQFHFWVPSPKKVEARGQALSGLKCKWSSCDIEPFFHQEWSTIVRAGTPFFLGEACQQKWSRFAPFPFLFFPMSLPWNSGVSGSKIGYWILWQPNPGAGKGITGQEPDIYTLPQRKESNLLMKVGFGDLKNTTREGEWRWEGGKSCSLCVMKVRLRGDESRNHFSTFFTPTATSTLRKLKTHGQWKRITSCCDNPTTLPFHFRLQTCWLFHFHSRKCSEQCQISSSACLDVQNDFFSQLQTKPVLSLSNAHLSQWARSIHVRSVFEAMIKNSQQLTLLACHNSSIQVAG